MSDDIPSPVDFFGHHMGEERRIVHWNKIVDYFWELDKSPSLTVTELGKSTEGNPFLLVVISSPENTISLKLTNLGFHQRPGQSCAKLSFKPRPVRHRFTS